VSGRGGVLGVVGALREKRGRRVGAGQKLSENKLVGVFPLVDLAAVGTSVLCVRMVLVVPSWFVQFQVGHYVLLGVLDPHH